MAVDCRCHGEYVISLALIHERFRSDNFLSADPPTTYPGAPVDLWGGLDYIQQQARAGDFTSQYEFDKAIMEHFSSAKEGHLSLIPCSANVFIFEVDQQLVSVSSDGFELPEVYTLSMWSSLYTRRERKQAR